LELLLTVLHQLWSKPPPTNLHQMATDELHHGLLALIDWDQQELLWTRPHDSPAGVTFVSDRLYVASMLGHTITVFGRDMVPVNTLRNPLFNDLHSLVASVSSGRLLLTSTGIDGLLELDERFGVAWRWLATDNGLAHVPDGRPRKVDTRFDYSRRSPNSSLQTTHINSAAYVDKDTICATLFYQGGVIAIDRRNGRWEYLVSGLDRPHSIRPAMGFAGWTVCDTGANAVALLDKGFHVDDVVEVGFNWVQDAIAIDERRLLVLDANNTRIVEVEQRGDRARSVREFNYDARWKAFGLTVVPSLPDGS
jgi:hypothetical protein